MFNTPAVLGQESKAAEALTTLRTVTAVRLDFTEKAILDQRLDEPFWTQSVPARDFIQQFRNNRAPPAERTEVRLMYIRMPYMGHPPTLEPTSSSAAKMKRDQDRGTDDRFMWSHGSIL